MKRPGQQGIYVKAKQESGESDKRETITQRISFLPMPRFVEEPRGPRALEATNGGGNSKLKSRLGPATGAHGQPRRSLFGVLPAHVIWSFTVQPLKAAA